MLGSLDPSKRKICVTVFLDELFEELSDDCDTATRETHSVVHVDEENTKPKWENDVQTSRPRKPRAQSKFGNDNYKHDMESRRCEFCGGSRNRIPESKSSLEMEFPEIITCVPVMRDSGSGCDVEKVDQEVDCASEVLSESIMTDESFLLTSRSYTKKVDQEVDCSLKTLSFTRSTQFDTSDVETPRTLDVKKSDSIGVQVNVMKAPDDRVKLKTIPEKFKRESSPETTPKEPEILIVGHSSEQISNISPEEVIRIWSTCKKVWSEGYESEMSEVDCITFKEDNSNKQYTVLVETDVDSTVEMDKTRNHVTQFVIPPKSDTKCHRLRYGTQEPKQHRSVNLEEQVKERVLVETTNKLFDGRPKNFAEGDTLEEPTPKQFVFKFESKEKVLVCSKQKLPSKTNEYIINTAEVQYSDKTETIAEMYKKENENSDAESDTVFAENPQDMDNARVYTQVFDLEETTSSTKCLRRMKTLEILADASLDDLNSLNTEVILFCENLSRDVSVEAWEEGSRNLAEARELCLKDSKDSSVYLIEIPFQFVKTSRNKESVAFKTDTE